MNKETTNTNNKIKQEKDRFFIFSILTALSAGSTGSNLAITAEDPDVFHTVATCISALALIYFGYKLLPSYKNLLKGRGNQR